MFLEKNYLLQYKIIPHLDAFLLIWVFKGGVQGFD